jgi:hypothetical protein
MTELESQHTADPVGTKQDAPREEGGTPISKKQSIAKETGYGRGSI